jgi:hypothetical protein
MMCTPKVGRINIKKFIGKEFGIAPDSLLLVSASCDHGCSSGCGSEAMCGCLLLLLLPIALNILYFVMLTTIHGVGADFFALYAIKIAEVCQLTTRAL